MGTDGKLTQGMEIELCSNDPLGAAIFWIPGDDIVNNVEIGCV